MTFAHEPRALGFFEQLGLLSSVQRHTLVACLLGWALDAFDFFLLTFSLKAVAQDFSVRGGALGLFITVTLAMRPVGAVLFGWAAERYGRRKTLIVNVISYSVIELLSAGSTSLVMLLALRAVYGVAMGGEWGVGTALAMEAIPEESRGAVSGILQQGYPVGYLLASLVFGLFFDRLGWRGMLVVGALPAGLVLYLRAKVPESRDSKIDKPTSGEIVTTLRVHLRRFVFLVVLMTAFNCFSHGTQDLYPTFLLESGLDQHEVGVLGCIGAVGAILGGLTVGALSERFGRRRTIAAAALLALPVIPLWVLTHKLVLLGAGVFALQVMVQGAWGIVPAHLSELSPGVGRALIPGLAYQLGNLLASGLPLVQSTVAEGHSAGFPLALGGVTAVVAAVLAVTALAGPEAKGIAFKNAKGEPTWEG